MQTEYVTFIADFKIHGRLAFLSHQETLSLWRRVLVRAQVPLIFSQGYNPHPRLSLALPRSVGVQSDCERLCARVSAAGFCARTARDAITPLLPDGCTLISTDVVPGRASFYPVSATYQFILTRPPDPLRQARFDRCLRQLQAREPIVLLRQTEKRRQREIDIGPFLRQLTHAGTNVEVQCMIGPEGTVRIDELMHWLGLAPADLVEPVRRMAADWVSQAKHWQGEENLS
ncbi:MAG TPA: DUF2344 domain-containing protein [Phycisphaerales bacterium]|nr:DUF2344 domain-containing protein [Phycisphaerales bacterium]